ncbi:class I SAM-dependent methyltransferase [Lentzea sp. DG1S-22]|uniref:class I SAM-dependent methyltransferase n=1 Tax=Lentzea sp. DG1S-22 TaxID=3108822 RepID=UPI002E78E1E2|nr:class I SAM-dependent methyltransferase [Lentzea sp. DG1S-22]WVH81529.1 class I SAM-dependent methyltransferase [Lentzea sp. DG1S-22]
MHSTDVLHRLSDTVDGFLRSEKEFDLTDPAANGLVGGRFRALGDQIGATVLAGVPEEDVAAIVQPAKSACARSPFMRDENEWARGYPSDFRLVEHVLAQANGGAPGTLGWHVEAQLQRSALAQQLRNRVVHQARLIGDCLTAPRSGPRRILVIDSGAAPDLRTLPPGIVRPGDRFVLTDVDPDALELAQQRLGPLNEFTTAVPGNIFRAIPKLAEQGPYDLVLANGLYGYLNDRAAVRLTEAVLTKLTRPGSTVYFAGTVPGNEFRWPLEYLMDWQVIERDEQAVRALLPRCDVSVTQDPTGLALLTHARVR